MKEKSCRGKRGNARRGVMPDTIIYKVGTMLVTNELTLFTALLSAKTDITERLSRVARYFAFYGEKTLFLLSLTTILQLYTKML